jgi:hypothetical protein
LKRSTYLISTFNVTGAGSVWQLKKCEKMELALINQLINNEEKRVNTKKHRGYLFKDTVEAA